MGNMYIRTGKGNEEVSARRPVLDARLNSLLFLVDGKRTRDELNALLERLESPADTIERLVKGGYVRIIEEPSVQLDRPDSAANNSRWGTSSLLPASSLLPTHTEVDSTLQDALYQYLIAAAKQHLGIRGLLFHLKIEKATDLPQLRALITPMGEAIAKAKGLATGNNFMAEVRALVKSGA